MRFAFEVNKLRTVIHSCDVEAIVIIEFDIAKQGIFVEHSLSGKGLYIQSGRDGDRLLKDPHRPKVLLEIPNVGFRKDWDSLFQ